MPPNLRRSGWRTDHPDLAARLWRAQGIRIVDAKKSKYYDAALSNFERARDCYLRAGLAVEWEKTVRQVFAAHFRKSWIHQWLSGVGRRRERAEPPFLSGARQGALGPTGAERVVRRLH